MSLSRPLFVRWKALAATWFENRKPPLVSVLFTISLVISGCERGVPSPPAGLLGSHEAQHAGAVIFATNCAICHGASADGRGQRREGMNPPPANLTLPPWSEPANAGGTFLAIRNGVPRTAMPPWPAFNDQEVWNLVAYITSLNGR
jgi:mono/diheme cytochrome c family protein